MNKELGNGFKYIPGYEQLYSIDENGNVFSHIKMLILKPLNSYDGYFRVDLCKDGHKKRISVHRLVALTYIPNPNNLPEIDHLDTNRHNNNVSNLRWCTKKENCNNPISLQHRSECKKGEKCYNFGKHLSEKTKARMSVSLKGHKVSEETRRKIGVANSRQVRQYDKQGNLIMVWDSFSQASRALGIFVNSISQCANGRYKTAGGFVWKK